MRITIAIACTGCERPGKSIYWISKNKKNDPDRIELKKILFVLPEACRPQRKAVMA